MFLDVFYYYNMIKNMGVDIIYSGPMWADGVEGVGETLKKRMAFDDLPLGASQAVFSVFVEQMNNMLMYSAEREMFEHTEEKRDSISKGIFIMGTKGKTYFIQTGNIIKDENIDFIKKNIDFLNSIDKVMLRKYYKEQLKRENTNPESKGAGLGLIEIARRASSKIEYDFRQMDDGFTFFSMSVMIG